MTDAEQQYLADPERFMRFCRVLDYAAQQAAIAERRDFSVWDTAAMCLTYVRMRQRPGDET